MLLSRRSFLIAGVPLVSAVTTGCLNTENGTGGDEMIYRKGERLVSVTVDEGFSNEVVIEANCRDEAVTVAPGESARIERQMDGEECSIRLVADGEELHSVMVYEYAAYELTVKENGDVDSLGAER